MRTYKDELEAIANDLLTQNTATNSNEIDYLERTFKAWF